MKAIGFLTALASVEALPTVAQELVATLAGMAPIPLLGMKKHLNRIARGAQDTAALQADMARAAASADLREGQAAWTEKRPPRFTGS
jgi:1,4-dihydroxy-2-naphthoyl-CoA synthase